MSRSWPRCPTTKRAICGSPPSWPACSKEKNMCLSTVYKNEQTAENVVMKNVMAIECKDGCVILTDLMERTVALEGRLVSANLVDGYVIVKTA
ncbi:MAG: CooT family nickel-binding protein [Ruminococcaceae bacterium]|nr:CooT family nickel-binding protein [Oscillospiraceae bacterium]